MTAARRHTAPGHQLLAFLARSARSFFLVRWRFFCNPRFVFFRLAHKMRFHSMIGKHGLIFGIGQHGGILSSLCDKRLHNKHLDRIYSPWHDVCSSIGAALTKFMKTTSIPPPAPIWMSAFASDTILP